MSDPESTDPESMCRIEDWRRLDTRFDKLARNFFAATCLAAALYWVTL